MVTFDKVWSKVIYVEESESEVSFCEKRTRVDKVISMPHLRVDFFPAGWNKGASLIIFFDFIDKKTILTIFWLGAPRVSWEKKFLF
jgi:hypothetical protein